MRYADDGHCFVCGPENPIGLKLQFAHIDNKVRAEFNPSKKYQGYMDIVHGGILSTVLDEAMVKIAIAEGMPAVTAQMDLRLKKPLHINQPVIIEAEITGRTRKILKSKAWIITKDGTLIAEASGTLIKLESAVMQIK
ncbi:MAG: PaaI family thioesterase [Nitrospira sp.]|nr:PaaI family thioesterase [bacterium]MBL7049054.1 PaaI family thioesterase [Nitrospira sp.]